MEKIHKLVLFQVGVSGEKKQLYTEEGSRNEKWLQVSSGGNGAGLNTPITWYKVNEHGKKKKKLSDSAFSN